MSRIQTFSLESMRRIAKEVFREEREADHLKHPAVTDRRHYDPFDYQHEFAQELHFRNVSGEEIPAFGVIRVDGIETKNGRPIYKAAKPDDSFSPLYLVNGPLRVGSESTAYGFARYLLNGPGQVLVDLVSGTPAIGFRWGPKDDSWKLHAHYQGFGIRATTTGTTQYGDTWAWATQDPVLNDTVYYFNDSGESIPAFAVIELTDEFDAAGRQYGIKPTTDFQRRYLVNGDRITPADKPGYGSYLVSPNNTISSRVLCATSANLGDEYGATPGEWFLSSFRPGFHMLGNATVSGDYYTARAIQREVTRLKGVLTDGAIDPDDSSLFVIHSGAVGSETDAGWDSITCWHRGCDPIDNNGQDLRGYVVLQDSQWIYYEDCCPEDES